MDSLRPPAPPWNATAAAAAAARLGSLAATSLRAAAAGAGAHLDARLLVSLCLAVWLTWKTALLRHRRALRAVQARADFHREDDARFESCEVGGGAWLNHLLKSTWHAALEPQLALQASENLQEALDKLVARRRGKVLDSAKLHELTFGTAPPHVRVCRSRYDPATRYLQLELDILFETVGFQALFDLAARPVPVVPPLRLPLALRDLSLRGRVLLGFALAPPGVGIAPGVSRLEMSFAEPPRFDVRLEALGLPLGDVPGVEGWLRRSLAHLLQSRFVEPRRAVVHAPRVFARQTLAKRAGPGGTLVVVVAAATALGEGEGESGAPSCYVELRYAGAVRRTHVAPQRRSPHWGATLTFPVPAWAGAHGRPPRSKGSSSDEEDAAAAGGADAGPDAGSLRISVVHWAAPGAPALLGEAAAVAVTPRTMGVHAGAPLHARTLQLRGSVASRAAAPPLLHVRLGVLAPGAEEYALALAAEAAAEREAALAALVPTTSASSLPGMAAAAAAGAAPPQPFSLADWDPSEADVGEAADAWAGLRQRASSPAPSHSRGSLHHGHARPPSGAHHLHHSSSGGGSAAGSGGGGAGNAAARAALTHAKSAAGEAARELLTTLAYPSAAAAGGGGGVAQAVSRLATAAVVAAQAAAGEAAQCDGSDHNGTEYAPFVGRGDSSTSDLAPLARFVGSPGHARGGSNMDRLLAAGVRAVDAAVAAAGGAPPAGPGSVRSAGSLGGTPGHSRHASWDGVTNAAAPPAQPRTSARITSTSANGHANGNGHHRSASADSAADGGATFSDLGGPAAHYAPHAGALEDNGGPVVELQRRLQESQRRVRELESALSLETQLREAEDVRALVEGARFLLHTPRGVKPRHVWYSPRAGGRLCWAASAERRADAAERTQHWVPLSLVEAVEAGATLFDAVLPGSAGGSGSGWLGARPGPAPRDARSAFSVLLKAPDAAAAAAAAAAGARPAPAALHLELPPGGNGRSAREWMAAFGTVVRKSRDRNAAGPLASTGLLAGALDALAGMSGGGGGAGGNGGGAGAGMMTSATRASRAAAAALQLIDAGRAAARNGRAAALASGSPSRARSPGPSRVASPLPPEPPEHATPPPLLPAPSVGGGARPATPTRRVLVLGEDPPPPSAT